jgi:hypothetical protein
LTLASQLRAGPPGTPTEVLPELIATRQAIFSIPFRVERSSDPTWQPVEAQLYVSTDRGSHWRLYTSVPTAEKHFTFRAGGDGEFWFAICTADRSGQTRPKTVESPGLRVLVDTKPPALKVTARPVGGGQVTVHWEIDELNLKPNSLTIVYRPSATEPWQAVAIDPRSQDSAEAMQRGEISFQPKSGSSAIPIRAEVSDVAGNTAVANALVKLDGRPEPQRSNKPTGDVGPALMPESNEAVTVAGKPAIGRKYEALGETSKGASTFPGLPPGERPRMVNSRTFDLEYEVDSVGPSGIGRVELWGSSDAGQTWRRFTTLTDKRNSLRVNVPDEGLYGFRVVVTNGAGFGAKPPMAGDPPDLWIGVDLTKPTARIVSAQQGVESESGQLIISWQADDKLLAARPVSLSFSPSRGGPWTPIAAGLENSGRYAWPIDNRTPPTLFLRLEVRDEAGNVAVHETSDPVAIDQSHPKVRIRSVRPVGQAK